MSRFASVVTLGTAAVLALTACSADSGTDGVGTRTAEDTGMVHVHGLGVDPADGVLYAATHYGLFRLRQQGPPLRVADRFQDTMGFTITGPNTFLGSGHPDNQKDPALPPRLGLVRSTDAAQSWQTVSLSGEVDFHALRAAHGAIYGWDSGRSRLMVSTDQGRTWDIRSTLDLRDFAVSPTDADVVLATTESGLVRSADGGRSWRAVKTAPGLAMLGWGTAGSLFGVSPNGTVQRSEDGGTTWGERGTVEGQPEALTVDVRNGTETLYIAVNTRGILASTDSGATFTSRYSG